MSGDRSARRIPLDPDERRIDTFAIGQDAFQFRFDFWQSQSADDEHVVTRIVIAEPVARDFAERLQESLREHDERWS